MFVGQATLEYGYTKKLLALEPERYRTLQKAVASAVALPLNQEAIKEKDEFGLTYGGTLMDERTVQAFTDAGIKVTLENVRGLLGSRDEVHNTIYQVVVPEIGVLHVKNVEYLYDADERAVNDMLDKGWRILCIAPPRAAPQRGHERADENPTYVMGHTTDPKDRP
jgi:hypothetical protein